MMRKTIEALLLGTGIFIMMAGITAVLPVYAAAPSDYSLLTNAFKARGTFLESKKDDRGRSLSVLNDCGESYELSNMLFYTYRKYDADEIGAAMPGDTVRINGKAYQVTEISEGEDGLTESLTLMRTDAFGDAEYEYLRAVSPGKNKKRYYVAEKKSSADGSFDSADLYACSSVFIRKDAVIESRGGDAEGQKVTVTAEEYLTGDLSVYGDAFAGGYQPREGLWVLNGSFTLDENGYIIEFNEK